MGVGVIILCALIIIAGLAGLIVKNAKLRLILIVIAAGGFLVFYVRVIHELSSRIPIGP